MLEFSSWFFVLIVNFLVLLFLLNKILFRPMLAIFKQREEAIEGSIEQAKKMAEEKDAALDGMKADFAKASIEARAKFEELRAEGHQRQKESLEEAAGKASESLDAARGQLRAESEKARQSLKADVEKFSDEIVNKLVGA